MNSAGTDGKWLGTERQEGESLVQRRFLKVHRENSLRDTREKERRGGRRTQRQRAAAGGRVSSDKLV